jgi:hypothetical protein
MANTLVVNGHTYTDDSNEVTGLGNGGHRVRLLPMLSDVMVEVTDALADVNASVDQVSSDATQVASDAAQVALDAASVSSDKSTVQSLASQVTSDKNAVATNKAAVDTAAAQVASDKTAVATNKAAVDTAAAQVASDAGSVASNKAAVDTAAAQVASDKTAVATNKAAVDTAAAQVASDKATTQGYRDEALTYRDQAFASVGGVKVTTSDTTAANLNNKVGVAGLATKATTNPGSNEVLTITVTATTAATAAAGTSTTEAVTPAALRGWTNALPELTSGQADSSSDFIPIYDASGTVMCKVKPANLGIGTNTRNFVASGTLADGSKVALRSDGKVEVVTGSDNPTLGATATYTTNSVGKASAVYDAGAGRIVVFYGDGGNSERLTAVVGQVSGTSITWGTPVVADSASNSGAGAQFRPVYCRSPSGRSRPDRR